MSKKLCILALGAFLATPAVAGTCRYFSDGGNAVQSCDNGSYRVTDPHGHVRQFGRSNGGFEMYPGQPPRPIYRRREGE
jgi:hypothetical protein